MVKAPIVTSPLTSITSTPPSIPVGTSTIPVDIPVVASQKPPQVGEQPGTPPTIPIGSLGDPKDPEDTTVPEDTGNGTGKDTGKDQLGLGTGKGGGSTHLIDPRISNFGFDPVAMEKTINEMINNGVIHFFCGSGKLRLRQSRCCCRQKEV